MLRRSLQTVLFVYLLVGGQSQSFETSRLRISGLEELDQIGHSLDLSDNDFMVGSPYFRSGVGVAMLYSRDSSSSTFQRRAVFEGPRPYEMFGASVAVMRDFYFVGAPAEWCYDGEKTFRNCGMTFAYTEQKRGNKSEYTLDGKWYRRTIHPPVAEQNTNFGAALAASPSGDLAIGSPGYEGSRGQVHIFRLDDNYVWTVVAILESPSVQYHGNFGSSLSFYNDLLVVGAPGDNINGIESTGTVSVYTNLHEISGTSSWGFVQRLYPSDLTANSMFGVSVSLYRDTLVVGAQGASGHTEATGAAYVYKFAESVDGESRGTWFEADRLIAHDGESLDEFGCSVSIRKDTVVVGACGEDGKMIHNGDTWQVSDGDNCGTTSDPECVRYNGKVLYRGDNAGAVYVYGYNYGIPDKYAPVKKILPEKSYKEWKFGYHVATDGDTVVVCASGASDGGVSDVGAVYIVSIDWTKSMDELLKILGGMLIGAGVISGAVFIYVMFVSKSQGYRRTDGGHILASSSDIDISSGAGSVTSSKHLLSSFHGGDTRSHTPSLIGGVHAIFSDKRSESSSDAGSGSGRSTENAGWYHWGSSVSDNGLGDSDWGIARPKKNISNNV